MELYNINFLVLILYYNVLCKTLTLRDAWWRAHKISLYISVQLPMDLQLFQNKMLKKKKVAVCHSEGYKDSHKLGWAGILLDVTAKGS